MKKSFWGLICLSFIASLIFCCALALTKDRFWLILFACVIVVVASFLLFLRHSGSKTEKVVSQRSELSERPAVIPSNSKDNVTGVTREAIKEKTAPEPIRPKQEEEPIVAFPLFKSEYHDGDDLKRCLEDIKAWCLKTSESTSNPNDKNTIKVLFEQLNDCVDCQICLDSIKSAYTRPFIEKLGSVEPGDNAQAILQDLIQLAMFMIDLSRMSHLYGNNEVSKEDRLWIDVLKGEQPMAEAMKKARRVDDNPQVTSAQYRNLKAFLRGPACISEDSFRIYDGYIL